MTTLTTLVPLPPDLVHRDRVRRQALRAGGILHAGLAPLRDAAFVSDGLALTWTVPADAVTSEPGEMTAAEVVRLVAPVAAGLAMLHDGDLAHGGVAPASILGARGEGILVGWRPGGIAADDVRDLIAVLDAWLPPASVGADIAQVLIAGADPDPDVRPSMAAVAAALDHAAHRSLPPTSPPAHRRARMVEAPPPRPAEPAQPASPRGARGRHAARRAPVGRSTSGLRLSWRWGAAGAGALAAGVLAFTAIGPADADPAQTVCPAAVVGGASSPG